MPRNPPPQCAANHAPRTAACRHRRRCRLAHPSLQMKFPIRWHIQRLTNMRANHAKKVEQYRREAESLDRDFKNIVELEAQIQRAWAEKRADFDPEKFNKKRK
jgi:hypothetical protein